MPVIDFDPPERFIADAVGPPGSRTFFLQAVTGTRVMTVSLEKEQVRLLGESVTELLDEMAPLPADSEHSDEAVQRDTDPLHTPIEEDFRARALTLAWDPERRTVTIEASERDTSTDEDGPHGEPEPGPWGAGSIRVVLSVSMARGFAERCASSLKGGRPNCPFCGGPLDATGHICPRANGYRR